MIKLKKSHKGFSLIEMIIFIVIIGISVTAMLLALQVILKNSPQSNIQTTAIALAQGRMDLILGQKQEQGFTNFSDPCNVASPPSYCALNANYTVTSNISPVVISGDSNYKTITVTIKNAAGNVLAVLETLVGS